MGSKNESKPEEPTEMKMSDCPVCGSSGTIRGAEYGRDVVRFDCQRACHRFVIDGWFFKYDWPHVSEEDKEALAAYLKNGEKPVDLSVLISEETYKYYVGEGKEVLRLAASPQVSP
jgi:hypothetical protein